MKQTYLLFTAILLLINFSCSGQSKSGNKQQNATPAEAEQQIGEYVVEAFEDSKGNLWFGTMNYGAARYDGKKLQYVTTEDGLIENTVFSIVEDSDGNLWFGSHRGITKFDGKNYTKYGAEQGLTGPGCQIFIDSKGNFWTVSNHGAFLFNGKTFEKFEIPTPEGLPTSYKWEAGKIWNIMEDSKGNIWFGRDGLGACKYDGTNFTHFTKKDGLSSNNVSRIVEDDNGNFWFGTLSSDFPDYVNEGGLSLYDGKQFTSFPDFPGLTKGDVYSVHKDKANNIWIGAIGVGVYKYDGKEFSLIKETNRMDLTSRMGLQPLLEDSNGIIWMGFSGGLFRLEGKSIINVTKGGPWN
jgi:ligand-binding sensor domain-containing protein